MTNMSSYEVATSSHPHDDVYCYCLHALTCHQCGKPRADRTGTKAAVQHMLEDPRPIRSNVYGQGPLLLSDVPVPARTNGPVVLGIDEAGRGSVLGPMVYGLAYWSAEAEDRIPSSFNDSKQLTEEAREKLWSQILDHADIGFACKALLPNEISRNMLRMKPYNLNEQSHDTAMTLIRKLLQANVTIQTCYIDTVGNPGAYRRKLEREFPHLEFVVESKADAKYAPCSAASVVAKVMRDRLLAGWKFSEPGLDELHQEHDFGSGYPSDPKCKAWMTHALQDRVFGYSDLVRFSWAPIKARLTSTDGASTNNDESSSSSNRNTTTALQPATVTFAADLDDEEMEKLQNQKGMSTFLGATNSTTGGAKKRKRSTYFKSRKLQVVNAI